MKTHQGNSVSFVLRLAALVLALFFIQQCRAASWVANGPLATARYNHSVTLLPNGKVLVAGGITYSNGIYDVLSTAELFDPAAGTCTIGTNLMGAPRANHTATLLPNGKVLVAGGWDGKNLSTTSELYDIIARPCCRTERFWL